ncbi:hypothetical protein [Nostoc sp.]|uniref:hypothetical protein n=1 Tax=Nostoc sp. TaxID=1180 RepID=UPI002FF58EE9
MLSRESHFFTQHSASALSTQPQHSASALSLSLSTQPQHSASALSTPEGYGALGK